MDFRFHGVTPQSGNIASLLQLITQCTPREKGLPQLPSALRAQEMYQIQQELMKRQGSKLEKSYIELTPGTPVWVQHRQNTAWEPATVVSQCTTNLLDPAREQYRAAKSIQEDQIHVKDQIHSNRSQTDRVYEQPVYRTRES